MDSSANPLASRRLVEILDRTFRIYRENFVAFVALTAVVLVPVTLVGLAVQPNNIIDKNTTYNAVYPNARTAVTTANLVALLGALIQSVIINGLITHMTSENILGRSTSVAEAYSQSKGRFLPLVGAIIVAGILFFVLFIAVIIASMCVVPVIFLPVVLYLALCTGFYIVPVMMLERVGVILSLRRALVLAKRRFWHNFGFVIGVWVIVLVLTTAFGYFVLFVVPSAEQDNVLVVAVDLTIRIFTTPILPVGLTLMYYDTRIRTEALDIALESVDTLNPRPSDVFSPDPRERLITGKDVGNIVILMIGVVAVFAGLFAMMAIALSM